MSPDQSRIVAAALSWVGTPFHPHSRAKGAGVDCVHLALAVYQEAGIIAPDVQLPSYGLARGEQLLASEVEAWVNGSGLFEVMPGPAPGRAVGLRIGKVVHHVGICTRPGHFVQCIRKYGVREFPLADSTWASRIEVYWKAKLCLEAQRT